MSSSKNRLHNWLKFRLTVNKSEVLSGKVWRKVSATEYRNSQHAQSIDVLFTHTTVELCTLSQLKWLCFLLNLLGKFLNAK